MGSQKQDLLLFFDRPVQPCFMQKGEGKVNFDIPEDYYPEKYKPLINTLSSRFGKEADRTIRVKKMSMPSLTTIMELKFDAQFSLFVPRHREISARLTNIFMGLRDLEDLMAFCTYAQLRVNPYMFNYCLSVALLHRPDTKDLNIPALPETFPDKFMDPKVFRSGRQVSRVLAGVKDPKQMPIVIPQNLTASDAEPEQRVAYFREDIGVNLHHWHWHLVYPFDSANRDIVAKNRRGELLYYMHQQIIARYNIERFCNDLSRTVPFGSDLKEPISEGYFPKLNSQVAGRTWPPRFANTVLLDVERPMDLIKAEVYQMELWRSRILEAIESNSILMPNGERVPLDEEKGIDVLGDLMEASIISPNRSYYGDFHNVGHILAAYVHDPDYRHLEQPGVMGDPATAMRDPVFYRWHMFVDDIFTLHKNKLPPYGNDKLDFPDIRVSSIAVEGKAGKNIFATHWEQSTVELSRGLDFMPSGSVKATNIHLQHEEFDYVIEVENTSGKNTTGTVRIFMAPVADETGKTFEFNEQRRYMIELDKFTKELTPGKNPIHRRSIDSSITIPYERVFRKLDQGTVTAGTQEAVAIGFCGCGWPQYMLLPRGTKEGYPMVLFVMVSNWADDKVTPDIPEDGKCKNAASFCGLRDRKYPDRRPMGFPFDRPVKSDIKTVKDFLKPNMAITNCTIRFTDTIKLRGKE